MIRLATPLARKLETDMRKRINIGDLVYVPSEVIILKLTVDGITDEWKKIDKPISLLVTNIEKKRYEVLHENQYWLVEKKSVYKV